MSDYPEHDKMSKVSDLSQAIGEFIETSGYVLAEWERKTDCYASGRVSGSRLASWSCVDGRMVRGGIIGSGDSSNDLGQCATCEGSGLVDRTTPVLTPRRQTITQILADYFEIDLAKIDAEKDAMLAALRSGPNHLEGDPS